jgi:hypothetical protein
VDVGTADACVVHCKEDVVRGGGGRERGLRHFFERDFVGRVENKGEVLLSYILALNHSSMVAGLILTPSLVPILVDMIAAMMIDN